MSESKLRISEIGWNGRIRKATVEHLCRLVANPTATRVLENGTTVRIKLTKSQRAKRRAEPAIVIVGAVAHAIDCPEDPGRCVVHWGLSKQLSELIDSNVKGLYEKLDADDDIKTSGIMFVYTLVPSAHGTVDD